jgi:hypothetical protein
MKKPILKREQPPSIGGPLDFADDSFVDDYGVDPDRNGLTQCNLRVLAAAFAIRAYRAETGKLPRALDEVYKRLDPYTGIPFIYKVVADGFQIYSPGYDGDDDGGVPALFTSKGGDITVARRVDPSNLDKPVVLR